MIRVAVVDDEPLGRRGIISRLGKTPGFEVIAECCNGREAVTAIREGNPDLVFLDVQMPGMNGFDVLEALGPAYPGIIFVTAYDQHALRAFEVNAIDYILKPIDDVRFGEAVSRAKRNLDQERQSALGRRLSALLQDVHPATGDAGRSHPAAERFVVRSGGRIRFVRHTEIDWIEAAGDYVRLHAGEKSWLLRETMAAVESALPSRRFVRIHRSTIVNLERIRELRSFDNGDYSVLMNDSTELRLSRSYRAALQRLLHGRL
jgi:two-component system, LytTR family, response regulator